MTRKELMHKFKIMLKKLTYTELLFVYEFLKEYLNTPE